ncbi:response regulator [Asticcacaulis biprosthecium C19]|uniref:Response regulator n=1 Tax=Asticcacaulis biprosthecium C19 TaxID=715226 RepID=F4QH23_9CAUL|nr:response regulator [Asticcacaulis biprosthecium]EGF92560.1 response regulator [Asticcacaulis biprosthecium C19]
MDKTALLLEDSKTQANIIIAMLSRMGWSAVHCETIRDACETLSQISVHAMLLDVFVGDHNTLLHVDRFRSLAPHIPMMLMTAGSSREAIEETLTSARKTGADYVLKKPFNEALLRDVFASLSPDVAIGKKRKHVLVIDDSSTIRMIAQRAYAGAGYRVSCADSMEEAFSNVDIAHVDLVLCDVFMPGMGGFKGMRTIKTTWPKVQLISMSAGLDEQVSDNDALNATRRIGADAQIRKPFDAEDLIELSAALLDMAA